MAQNKLEDLVIQQKKGELNQAMAVFHSSLVSNVQNNKLPESVFVQLFLPYFSGTPFPDNRNVIAEWIGIAGTPMSEVDIINDQGAVLYSVPSLFNTDMLQVANKKAGLAIGDIVDNYKLRDQHVRGSGERYLSHAIEEKLHTMLPEQPNKNPFTARWADIHQRYGIQTNEAASTPVTKTNVPDDDLEY